MNSTILHYLFKTEQPTLEALRISNRNSVRAYCTVIEEGERITLEWNCTYGEYYYKHSHYNFFFPHVFVAQGMSTCPCLQDDRIWVDGMDVPMEVRKKRERIQHLQMID